MKKILSVICLVSFILISCKSDKNSNVSGVYQGILPCANCDGIENKLILNNDLTFQLETTYLGKGDEKPFVKKGNYKIENQQLELLVKSGFKYQINDNYLELLDISGNKIESELNYKLIKKSSI